MSHCKLMQVAELSLPVPRLWLEELYFPHLKYAWNRAGFCSIETCVMGHTPVLKQHGWKKLCLTAMEVLL